MVGMYSKAFERAHLASARKMEKYIDENWTPTVPSARYDPPAVRTGKLRSSTIYVMMRDGELSGAVAFGYKARHAYFLEAPEGKLNRYFFGPALDWLQRKGIVSGEVRKQILMLNLTGGKMAAGFNMGAMTPPTGAGMLGSFL